MANKIVSQYLYVFRLFLTVFVVILLTISSGSFFLKIFMLGFFLKPIEYSLKILNILDNNKGFLEAFNIFLIPDLFKIGLINSNNKFLLSERTDI